MDYADTTIIIPTLNEAGYIKILLERLKSKYADIKIIVADDGSTDTTKEQVESISGCTFLDRTHEHTHGLTISVMDGLKLADTKYCVIMDADGQHPASTVGEIIKCLRAGADVVVGTRENSNMGIIRTLISWGAVYLGQMSLSLRWAPTCNDVVSGFFGIRRDIAVHQIILNYNKFTLEGYKILFDLLKVLPNTITVDEVYYKFGTRNQGHSKMRFKHIGLYFQSLMR